MDMAFLFVLQTVMAVLCWITGLWAGYMTGFKRGRQRGWSECREEQQAKQQAMRRTTPWGKYP